jgi:hypothetical protein
MVGLPLSSGSARAADPCSWVTPAEVASIVGGKLDGPPIGSGSTCTASFNRYQGTAQVQVVEGFGESSRYAGLVNFWQEENAKARKRGEAVEEKAIGDAFCWSALPNFTSPKSECMQELPGKRVLYARVSAPKSGGKAPPMDTTLKLLATAVPRAK